MDIGNFDTFFELDLVVVEAQWESTWGRNSQIKGYGGGRVILREIVKYIYFLPQRPSNRLDSLTQAIQSCDVFSLNSQNQIYKSKWYDNLVEHGTYYTGLPNQFSLSSFLSSPNSLPSESLCPCSVVGPASHGPYTCPMGFLCLRSLSLPLSVWSCLLFVLALLVLCAMWGSGSLFFLLKVSEIGKPLQYEGHAPCPTDHPITFTPSGNPLLCCVPSHSQQSSQCPLQAHWAHFRNTGPVSDYMHIFKIPFDIPILLFKNDVLLLFSAQDI